MIGDECVINMSGKVHINELSCEDTSEEVCMFYTHT